MQPAKRYHPALRLLSSRALRIWVSVAVAAVAVVCIMQVKAQTACGPPPAILQSAAPNIFSEQQEQWLGEAMADQDERNNRPIRNAALNAYLSTIGARLLAVLPPTTLRFQFTIVESSDINGFSLAGGHVYLTRKLVASARAEDEIAGVIAHEMGHILTHQFAIETTADLHRLLNIDSVSDRADIYAKYQRLTDARQHQKHQSDPDSDDKQDQADRVAVYAAAAAGYRPQAYAEFWDRSFFVGGKTGSRLGDFFGGTKPTEKRLRKIRGLIAQLPPGCGVNAAPVASAEFKQWQQSVLEDQAAQAAPAATASSPAPAASISGAAADEPSSPAPATAAAKSAESQANPAETEIQLTPPLRLDIERLRFSRDGKYILAQDESSIFVLSRDPFNELFRIDAERAIAAEFTPDSQELVFITPGLHMERWNLAQHKLVAAHEVVSQQSCLEMHLAPDGRTLACVFILADGGPNDGNIGLQLLDIETGQVLFRKKPWFLPTYSFEYALFLRQFGNDISDLLTASISADGNTLIIGPGSDRLAFDLRTRTPIKLEGALKSQDFPTSYCFLGSDKVVAVHHAQADQSGIFSFPQGKRLKQFKLSLPYMLSTTGGELVLTEGPKDSGAAVALANLELSKFVAASKSSALDAFDDWWVTENLDGSLLLTKIGADSNDPRQRERVHLNLSPLAPASSVALSPNGRYLAFSEHTRGTVWDLDTGKSAILVYGFRNPWWTPDNRLLAEFLPHEKIPRRISMIAISATGGVAHASDMTYTLPDHALLEQGHLFEWKQEKSTYNLIASSPFDAKQQWTRGFEGGRLGYTTNDGDTDLIFSFPLWTAPAKEKLRTEAALREQAALVKEKSSGRIIEIVNSADGVPRGDVVVEVPRSYEGVDGFNHVGDLLYLSTGDNRTIVYSFKTGAQLRQFFGTLVAADSKTGTICSVNRRDELIVMDKTGAELQHRSFGSPLRFAAFREDGTGLVVLTADQKVRRLKIEAK